MSRVNQASHRGPAASDRIGGATDQAEYAAIEVAVRSGVSIQTLRRYERRGLLVPATKSGTRRYSDRDIAQVRRIQRLMEDLEVNLAGVEVILHMREQIIRLRRELRQIQERQSGFTDR